MTGDFRALADLLADRLADYWLAIETRDHAWDNRHGSGPNLTPQDEAVLHAEAGVRNAAQNLTRLT